MQNNFYDFSIVLRTHNPDSRIIERTLRAIQKLKIDKFSYEVIVIESNCAKPLRDNNNLSAILDGINNLKIIAELKPGATNAMIAGVKNTNAKWVVNVDDDNEINPGYLINLNAIIAKYPNVGIWGPGEVWVDFIDKTTDWIEANCRYTFQEKKIKNVEFALQEEWNRCYPAGTGMCVRQDIFMKYLELFEKNNFRTTSRVGIGQSLMTGEDNQVIFISVLMGFAVGVCPDLKLNHLIPAAKSNFPYIKRLRFFTRYSVPLANAEILPDLLKRYSSEQLSQLSLFILLTKYLVKGILTGKFKEAIINCILIMGNFTGINLAMNKRNPYWLLLFLKTLGIKIK